jgi:hypothetical protein
MHTHTTILFLSLCLAPPRAISPIRAHAADVTDVSRESAKAEDFGMHAAPARVFEYIYAPRAIDRCE